MGKRKNEYKEQDLVRDVLQVLNLHGIFAFRNNSGRIFLRDQKGKSRAINLGVKGSPDIIGCIPPNGRFLAIECKQPSGKLSEYQKQFGENIKKNGGIFLIIRSIDEIIRFIQNMGQ